MIEIKQTTNCIPWAMHDWDKTNNELHSMSHDWDKTNNKLHPVSHDWDKTNNKLHPLCHFCASNAVNWQIFNWYYPPAFSVWSQYCVFFFLIRTLMPTAAFLLSGNQQSAPGTEKSWWLRVSTEKSKKKNIDNVKCLRFWFGIGKI